MTKLFCIVFILVIAYRPILGQQKYQALTNVISYEELQSKSVERKITWMNPDSSVEELKFIQMAIPFNETMKSLTRDFIHSVYGLNSIELNPKMIVFHAMGDGDLKTSLEVSSFLNDQIPKSWGNLSKAGKLSNGAHFIIDRDGTIICLSPPVGSDSSTISFDRDHHHWFIRRHQDGNPFAIGIENVTVKGNYTHLTVAQLDANAKLSRWLFWFEKDQIKFIASHHQFNLEKDYDRFLSFFKIANFQKQFRTIGRKDIGNKNLKIISERIRQLHIPLQLFFNDEYATPKKEKAD